MNKILRNVCLCLSIVSLVALVSACGSEETDKVSHDTATSPPAEQSAHGPSKSGGPATQPPLDPEAAAQQASKVADFEKVWKETAASKGIFLGEVPDDFPLDFLPLYPGGEIDKSSLRAGEATLLQVVPDPKDKVFAHYRDFYTGLGWTAQDPITVAGRTMVGFKGKGNQVDMTMIDREGGKTFVALALH